MVEKRIEQKNVKLHWNMLGYHLDKMVQALKKDKFVGVYGVPRGGLPIAVYISHHLNIPLLDSPCDECLIVDDILDSGNTVSELIIEYELKDIKIATIHYKKKSVIAPDFYDVLVQENEWIVYPWEIEKQISKDE